ncbi:HAMP domain-containing sensor histidine kinase [Clostridium sp. D33t1_170424_F3]|uniref:sensor histidine kinase n=1 Tax=Clostridium sp. D33t1_170424_F3 TaxID=2787099 RepID=UPI0018ABCC2B|nr:HAMP domain-containing sensor histidine kinase [Clostridium sp. D33t1_170424_F3]
MRRVNLKIGLIVLCYAILVSAVFLAAVLWLRYSYQEMPATPISSKNVYLLTQQESIYAYKQSLSSLDFGKIAPVSYIYEQFSPVLQSRLLPISIGFSVFVVLSSFLLWVVLKRFHTHTVRQIAQRLGQVADIGDSIGDQPEFSESLRTIREKTAAHMEDFKRLYHYLSHEQKNTIAILRQNLELRQNKHDLECLDHVTDSIDDVLTLSENENFAEKTEVNVILVCAEVCDLYRNVSKAVTFDYDEDVEPAIMGKERWIARAVSNLLDNALKYGQGGPVEVTVKNRHNCVIISVSDHGIGICEEEQRKIFDHWYRVSPLKKDGYGIGLSLVSHVCDLCGGYAAVESELGKGSTFYLSFPCVG